MKKRLLKYLLVTAFAIGQVATAVAGQPKWELTFSHSGSEIDTQHLAAVRFSELVAQRTDGQVKVKIFPGSVLGNDRAMVTGVSSGIIGMGMAGTPYFTGMVGRMNVLDLPYMFDSAEHAHRVLDGAVGRELLDDLEQHEMKGLAYFEVGFRSISNSRRAIHTPADVRGLKLRTTPNPAHIAAFKLLGANPTPMSFAEVYTALETRTVDGQENPVQIFWAANLYDVQKNFSLTRHAYTAMPLVMNKNKFDSLPSAIQNALLSSAVEAAHYHRELNADSEARLLAAVREKGVEVVEDVDRAAFKKVVAASIQQEFSNKYGTDLIDAINSAR